MTFPILQMAAGRKATRWLRAMFPSGRPVPVKVVTRYFLGVFLAFGALVAVGNSPVNAQAICSPRDQLVKHLSDQYKESPVGIGLAQSGQVLEIFASVSGSWSMVMTTTDGKTCLIAAGDNWETVAKVKGTGI